MTKCPNCGRRLHLYDWRPECPGCKTNLNYYNSNEELLEESEKAEIEHALFQPKIDRAKAAYSGNWYALLRIVFTLLPIAALFLPLCVSADTGEKLNILGVYKLVSEKGIGTVFGSALSNTASLSVLLLAVSLIMIPVSLILILLALGKHAKTRLLITYGLMALTSVGALITTGLRDISFSPDAAATAAKAGIGAWVYATLMVWLLVWNCIIIRKGIPVSYKVCLIGGLPGDEYFRYVEQGMSKEAIHRKMLVALAQLQQENEKRLKKEDEPS